MVDFQDFQTSYDTRWKYSIKIILQVNIWCFDNRLNTSFKFVHI